MTFRGGGCGPVISPSTVKDLGEDDKNNNDNKFTEDPHNEEEEEVQQEDVPEEDAQAGAQSEPPGISVVFDEAIHDITGYENSTIVELRDITFECDTIPAKKIKSILLGLPQSSLPTLAQINSSELLALCAP